MSSIVADTRLIFCEGEPDSLDVALLERMAVPSRVQVVPARGKGSIARFVEGYLRSNRKNVVFSSQAIPDYRIFRDRDFDAKPPDQPKLIRPGETDNRGETDTRILLSHRTCIENYFLDGNLFHEFWEYCHHNSEKWRFGPSRGSDFFETCIEKAARALLDYQSVRWALTALKPSGGWPTLKNFLGARNDDLPTLLQGEACFQKAQELLTSFSNVTQRIDPTQFQEKLDEFLAFFQQAHFWDSKMYKVHFSGKDINTMIQREQSSHIPSLNGYRNWAVKNFDWRSHPDLLELSKELESL